MSEMVKRVARAIVALGLDDRERPLAIARAAIAAMREPTEAMKQKGGDLDNGYGMEITEALAEEVWQAMIDEALHDG